MTEVQTHRTDARDVRKNGERREKEDMTPVPTQEQLDERAGELGKKEKADREERVAASQQKQEDLTATPTQAEADEQKCNVFGTTVEDQKKLNEAYLDEHRVEAKEGEDLTPTPTQDELDDVKKDIMYEPEDNPGGGTDPQKVGSKRRALEAERPVSGGGGYQTRAQQPAPAQPARAQHPAQPSPNPEPVPAPPRAKE